MAMMISDHSGSVKMCNNEDYCYLCARELKGKDRLEVAAKVNGLKGKLTSQRAVKFLKGGEAICICKDCIAKANAELNLPEEGLPDEDR
jgi:hypothetical protein